MYHGIFSLYMNIVTYICPPTVSVMWKILAVETTSILYNTLPVVFNGTRAIITRTTCIVHNKVNNNRTQLKKYILALCIQ